MPSLTDLIRPGRVHACKIRLSQADAALLQHMGALQQKDELSAKLQDVSEIEVTAFRCRRCGALAERVTPLCRAASHPIEKVPGAFSRDVACNRGCPLLATLVYRMSSPRARSLASLLGEGQEALLQLR